LVKLTKYFNDGIVINQNLVFEGKGKTTDDLLTELNNFGLDVPYLDTGGGLVRCSVKASSITRPDKHGEKSGWYAVNQLGKHTFCAYGNWRTGEEKKWSSVQTNDLSVRERNDLQKKLKAAKEEAEKHKLERYDEVAIDCANRFEGYEQIEKHPYLDTKKIKCESLRANKTLLVVPIYNVNAEIRSLQYISAQGEKRFVSASEVKGNFFPVGFNISDLPNLDKLIICEGMATSVTSYLATGIPSVCIFSANFGLASLANLREKTNARFLVAFDNDKSGLGKQKAEDCANAISNCIARIPSKPGDFNDLALEHGIEQVRLELSETGIGLKQYAVRNLVEDPPPREWLVDRLVEKSKPMLLASIGGVGKSMLSLDLGLKIIKGSGIWLDNPIKKAGNVVVLAAEDDRQEIHRRVNALDPKFKRFETNYDMFVFTVPDYGKPFTLLKEDSAGLQITTQAEDLIEELETINDLELVIIDPIQSFVNAPITTSQEASQMYCQLAARISAKFNCACLSIHHMGKTGLTGTEDSMQARASIRGASSIVDGHRAAIAIWLAPEGEAERICTEQGVDFDPMRVVKCGVVKANSSEIDSKVKTLFRRKNILEPINDNGGINWE
jgi:putative DNA primase/helicase